MSQYTKLMHALMNADYGGDIFSPPISDVLDKVVEVVQETFKKDPECNSETFCGLPAEEAKRIIQLYTLTKKEHVTDWATYIQGFEDGARLVSEEYQRIIKDTNDQYQRSLEVWTK